MSDFPSDLEAICETVHEAIRAWSKANGQQAQPCWADAPEWMHVSTKESVQSVLANPQQAPGAQHVQWLEQKKASGWKFGPEKDEKLKTHPMMIPFHKLPEIEQKKDALLIAVVTALSQ